MSQQDRLHVATDEDVKRHPAGPIVDCTSGDVYEIARLHSSDPLPTSNGLLAVKMPCPFVVRQPHGTEYGEAGDYLVEHRQRMERHVILGWKFEFLFNTRQ